MIPKLTICQNFVVNMISSSIVESFFGSKRRLSDDLESLEVEKEAFSDVIKERSVYETKVIILHYV